MSGNPRRSTRFQTRNSISKYTDLKGSTECKFQECDSSLNFENDKCKEESQDTEINNEKPTELFSKTDVDGKTIYPVISTSIKKNAMFEKAKMFGNVKDKPTISLKKDLRICLTKVITNKETDQYYITTDSNRSKKKIKLRNKISKKKLHFLKISSESSADETNNDNNIDENFECNSNKDEKKKVNIIDTKLENNILRSLRPRVNKGYHLKADEYFTTQSEKSVTSNHTLNRLRNRHLDEETLQQLLANDSYISKTHKKKIEIISESLILCYKEWLYIMEEGFTVLLFGLGSKRLLINNFRKEVIFNEPTLVINGFFPSLTIKDILDNIIVELLGLNTVTNQNECYDIIEKTMKTHPDDCIYLLIHNIDCGMLRLNKAQDMLSRLANIPNIHMLASVDHINAPLLWDNVKRARYNFYWMDVTTFLPYQAEISYESSLLVQKSGVLALLSLENVFASLTSNAKAIYIILVKYQLEHNGNNYSGMAFKDLYMSSREAFLVSSDQALRAQLTEFIDHKLVKTKRQVDGIEYLIIPLDDALLKHFLEQQNDME